MLVAGSSQACALGSAVTAAVLGGAHPDFPSAQKAMTSLKNVAYRPDAGRRKIYNRLYRLYRGLHDGFGGRQPDTNLSAVMKDLLALKTSPAD
jgi:L-ribulokinase